MEISIRENRVIVYYEGEYYIIGEFERLVVEKSNAKEIIFLDTNGSIDPYNNPLIELLDFVTDTSHILQSPIEDSIYNYYQKIDYDEYVLEKYYLGIL